MTIVYIMYMMYTMATEEEGHKVAFTVFRNNLAGYLEKLAKGRKIVVYDARRGRTIVELSGKKEPLNNP